MHDSVEAILGENGAERSLIPDVGAHQPVSRVPQMSGYIALLDMRIVEVVEIINDSHGKRARFEKMVYHVTPDETRSSRNQKTSIVNRHGSITCADQFPGALRAWIPGFPSK